MVGLNRREIMAGMAALLASALPAHASRPDLRHLGLATPPLTIDAPKLNVPDLAGDVHKLEDYRGKTVLVSFWATWCPPCRKEMPSLARLSRELGTETHAVLAVNVGDKEERVRDFLENFDHDGMPILLDRDGVLPSKWFIAGLPVTYILDGTGTVVYGAIGERVWDSPDMISALISVI